MQTIVNQLTSNGQVLENKITKIGIFKVKMLSIKKFSNKKAVTVHADEVQGTIYY